MLEEQKQLEQQYVMPTFGRKQVEFVRGEGMHLEDSDGKKYLDFLAGIGVCSLGHCHPSVVEAVQNQASQLIHVGNYFYIENRGQVAEKISQLLNAEAGEGEQLPWKSFFANSGAEANECAIKLARLFAKKRAEAVGQDPESAPSLIVTLMRSFHGRTLATLAATAQTNLQKGFEPIPQGFVPTPINDIEAFEQLLGRLGSSICAVMLEPVQGESGVHPCTVEFLQAVRNLTAKTGKLLICDEVQSGIFRTGKPFAFQHAGIIPDIVTIAKGVASGVPAAACAARGALGNTLTAGTHGSTFGGSNLAMAAARVTLDVLNKEDMSKNIVEVGEYLAEKLSEVPGVTEVRGLGLMVGADIHPEINAPAVVDAALEEGLVINATGPRTLRFLPPLICSKAEVDEFIEKFTAAIGKLRG